MEFNSGFKGLIDVDCENRSKLNTFRGQNEEFLSFIAGGTYSYHCALHD